jgi:LmeA-like phospholipid-binding
MFILLRLVRTLVFLVLILAILGVVAVVAGRPFAERLAARSIEDRLGTPVTVSITTSLRPGVARGDLGKVTVRAKRFDRDGLNLIGTRAVYVGASIELRQLISGNVRLHYASVAFQGTLTDAALRAYLRPLLSERGLPARKLRVAITKGQATVAMGSQHATMSARIVGVSSIELVPAGGSAALAQALTAPIQLGPLPDGVQLTRITLRAGRALIAGSGDAGRIRA